MALKVLDSFRFHHGGGAEEAEVEVRAMLEDFLVRSARRVSPGGYLTLARDGYELVLSPRHDAVVDYRTIHRERTWSQVKNGVPSRFRKGRRRRPARAVTPEQGVAVSWATGADLLAAVDADSVHLTGRVLGDYDRLFQARDLPDEQLDRALRDRFASDLQDPAASVSDGPHVLTIGTPERRWLITPDLLVLVALKPAVAAALRSAARP